MRIAVSVLATLVVAMIVLLLYASEAGGKSGAQMRGVIQVVAVTGRVETPAPPLGREGNGERLRWSIRDRFGHTIGIGLFNCRWQLVQARLCSGEIKFPRGKLAMMGVSPTRSLGEWSVVGGTGLYVGAAGEMTFQATGIRRLTLIIEL